MNLLFSLPPALIQHVFEFDNTFRSSYQKVISQIAQSDIWFALHSKVETMESQIISITNSQSFPLYISPDESDFYLFLSSSHRLSTCLKNILPLLQGRYAFDVVTLYENLDLSGKVQTVSYPNDRSIRAEDVMVPFEPKRVTLRDLFYYDSFHLIQYRHELCVYISCDTPRSVEDLLEMYGPFFQCFV